MTGTQGYPQKQYDQTAQFNAQTATDVVPVAPGYTATVRIGGKRLVRVSDIESFVADLIPAASKPSILGDNAQFTVEAPSNSKDE